MDLLSKRSSSNYTTASADAEVNGCDERDIYNELVAYYNQVILDSRTNKGKSTKRYQAKYSDANYGGANPSNTPVRNNRVLHINDSHQNNSRSMTTRKLSAKNLPKSTHDIETQIINSDHVNCSTNVPKVEVESKLTFVRSNNRHEMYHNKNKNSARSENAEKTTYCRPAIDMYSHEFINKTMERNARLKGLVRRLVLARAKEKQKVAWNNYINDLKNKHRYNSSEPRAIPNYVMENNTPDVIDDYYRTRFTWKQSNPCENLLQDFYSASNDIDVDIHQNPNVNRPINIRPYVYDSSSRFCFPTASQGRLIMLNRERPKYQLANQSHHRSASRYRGIPFFVEKETSYTSTSRHNFKKVHSNKQFNKQNAINNLAVQTDFNPLENSTKDDNKTKETFKDEYNRVASNVDKLKQKIMQTQNEVKYCALSSIENKLDSLIQSINTFMVEIKSQKNLNEAGKSEACQFSNFNSLVNTTKSDSFRILKREQVFCGMVQERPRSTITFNEVKAHSNINDILYEEMHKSNQVKRDIEEILNTPSRSDRPSVHITFDIPTKERATEISDSLFKTKHSKVFVEKISSEDNRRMTIAVNTDPLGLLALFRVSAETVKQILSYMPQIDYCSYLSRLPLSQKTENEISQYVCNICGAAFERPSQLSDHIQQHNLGNVRDCCVCRHVLDMQRHRAGLFPCQHCGQRFTRAYCRELHEVSCAKMLGRRSDNTPSLMLLR